MPAPLLWVIILFFMVGGPAGHTKMFLDRNIFISNKHTRGTVAYTRQVSIMKHYVANAIG